MKPQYFFALLPLALYACGNPSGSVAISADKAIEAKVEKTLSGMSLDDKIGQIIELEINLVTYNDPSLSLQSIAVMSEEQKDALIHEYGLQDQFKASELNIDFTAEAPDMNQGMKLYALYNAIAAKYPFKVDEVALDSLITKYRVGSLLNTPKGTAQPPQVWNYLIKTVQDKSMQELGIPNVYGLDQMHGTTYTEGGTLFPSAINIAATFNPDLAFKMGEITAYETRACGVPWVYAPVVDMGRQQGWSRQYEGFGEDVYLTSVMSEQMVRGLQGPDPNHIDRFHVASTLKHYFAYGIPDNGLDRTPATISDTELRERQFAPFLRAFRSGALTTMTNSSIVNGMNGVANYRFLTQWLKEELGWDGMIVTDWADIENLRVRDHIAATEQEAAELILNAGVDMIMVPSSYQYNALIKESVEAGRIPQSRIDDAVRRILRLKYRLGLFDEPYHTVDQYPKFGSEEFAAYSRQAALESEVLLKNANQTLPIPAGSRILVTGPNANSMRTLNGGWSYTWQGSNTEKYTDKYNTIYEALCHEFGTRNVVLEEGVSYKAGGNWNEEDASGIGRAVQAARGVDYIVVCVGENSYAETTGNIPDISLSANQKALVKALSATGKRLVMVLNEGRARVIGDIVPCAQAVVDVLLPGNYGGDALAALLSGRENFSGRLPFTYSRFVNALVKYDYKAAECREVMSGVYDYDAKTYEQWWFGEGMSYTTFAYSNLKASKTDFTKDDVLSFTVDVTNTGARAGKEVVMLYSSDLYASLMPDNRRLRAFTKIDLAAGETRTVTLTINASDLAFAGADARWRLEEGDFEIRVGDQMVPLHCTETYVWNTPNIQ